MKPVGRIEIEFLKQHPDQREHLAGTWVLIWSGEHEAWWRPEGGGYTGDKSQAGIYSFEDAWSRTHHAGPEKRLAVEMLGVYEEIRAERAAQDRQWGGEHHDAHHRNWQWLRYLGKQLGRAKDKAEFRARMIKVAALAIAAVESLDKGRKP